MAASVRMNKLKNHLRQQLTARCVVVMKEDKKNYRRKCFQPVRYRDCENLSNQKTPLEYNKVLNA